MDLFSAAETELKALLNATAFQVAVLIVGILLLLFRHISTGNPKPMPPTNPDPFEPIGTAIRWQEFGRRKDLKFCPECDAVISASAEVCPNCGSRQPALGAKAPEPTAERQELS